MSRLAWLALASAGIVGTYLAVLFLVQRSLLFPIPASAPDGSGSLARRSCESQAVATEVSALFLAPRPAAGPAPLIVFMHGNAELADDWIPEFDPPRTWGVGVLLVEYPGYGRAPGAPSEKSITEAVQAAYDWAAADPRIDSSRIVAYGRSLGGAAAARLAVDRKVAALILESAFTSVADFAARFPVALVPDPRSLRQPSVAARVSRAAARHPRTAR